MSAQVGQTSHGIAMNVNASEANHVYILKNGQSMELGNFQDGTACTLQRAQAAATNTPSYEGASNFFKSARKDGTGTLNFMPGTEEDDMFNSLFDDLDNAKSLQDYKDAMFTIKTVNDLNGKVGVLEGAYVTSLPNNEVSNATNAIGYQLTGTEFYVNTDRPDVSVLK